jgi:hypothetical protein
VFSGLGLEEVDGEEGAGVLDIEPTFLEGAEAFEWGMAAEAEDGVFGEPIAAVEVVIDAFLAPGIDDLAGVGLEGIDAGVGGGGGIIPGESGLEFLGGEAGLPAFDDPLGVGPAEGGIGGAEVFEEGFGFLDDAGVMAEDGVDKTGLGAEVEGVSGLDGFVDGGVWGDAVEPEELVETEAEEDADGGGGFVLAGLAIDEPIEGGTPAEGAGADLVDEGTIGGWEAVFGEGTIEHILEETAGRSVGEENTSGNFSWFLRNLPGCFLTCWRRVRHV